MTPRLLVATLASLLAVGTLGGCGTELREEPAPATLATAATGPRVIAEFVGEVDATRGTLTLSSPDGFSAGLQLSGLTELEAIQDGLPNQGPLNSLELVTTGAVTDPEAPTCSGQLSLDAQVTVRSFYRVPIDDLYMEITRVTPSEGRYLCNSDPEVAGVSNQFGLIHYGSLDARGGANSAISRTWEFLLPDMTNFTFRGRLMGTPNGDYTSVVISQVYGGGGNSGAPYTNDFIELYNRGSTAVDLSGWSVQYASATGSTWTVTNLSGSIAPGGYFLVQQSGGTTGEALPAPNAIGSANMSATAGKVALVTNTTSLNGACPTGSEISDFLGYGTTANCYEAAPTASLSNTTAAIRNSQGCTDTDSNAADFTRATPTPRNSSSATHTCY